MLLYLNVVRQTLNQIKMELIIDNLKDYMTGAFLVNEFPSTGVVTVYNKRDLRNAKNILDVLCYKHATHHVSDDHFEILYSFN